MVSGREHCSQVVRLIEVTAAHIHQGRHQSSSAGTRRSRLTGGCAYDARSLG